MPSRRASGATRARAATSTSSSSGMSGDEARPPFGAAARPSQSPLSVEGGYVGRRRRLVARRRLSKKPDKKCFLAPSPEDRASSAAIGRLLRVPGRQIHVLFRFAQPSTFMLQFLGSLHFLTLTWLRGQAVAKGVRTASGAPEERRGRRPGAGRAGCLNFLAGPAAAPPTCRPRSVRPAASRRSWRSRGDQGGRVGVADLASRQRRQPGRDPRGRRHPAGRGAREERRERAADGQEAAVMALGNLAYNNPANQAAIVAAGAVGPLVALVRVGAIRLGQGTRGRPSGP